MATEKLAPSRHSAERVSLIGVRDSLGWLNDRVAQALVAVARALVAGDAYSVAVQ